MICVTSPNPLRWWMMNIWKILKDKSIIIDWMYSIWMCHPHLTSFYHSNEWKIWNPFNECDSKLIQCSDVHPLGVVCYESYFAPISQKKEKKKKICLLPSSVSCLSSVSCVNGFSSSFMQVEKEPLKSKRQPYTLGHSFISKMRYQWWALILQLVRFCQEYFIF